MPIVSPNYTGRSRSQESMMVSLPAVVYIATEFKAWKIGGLHLGATGDRYAVSHHTVLPYALGSDG